MSAPQIYGLAEIAQECNKTIHAVRKWQQRGVLPLPTARLVQGYVWQGPEIEAFLGDRRPTPAVAGS